MIVFIKTLAYKQTTNPSRTDNRPIANRQPTHREQTLTRNPDPRWSQIDFFWGARARVKSQEARVESGFSKSQAIVKPIPSPPTRANVVSVLKAIRLNQYDRSKTDTQLSRHTDTQLRLMLVVELFLQIEIPRFLQKEVSSMEISFVVPVIMMLECQ